MSLANISTALSTELQTIATANAYTVAWENQDFTPTAGETWLSENVIPATTSDPAVSAGYLDESGVYQVTIHTALGSYKGEAQQIASVIEAGFRRKLLEFNGQKVDIRSVTINPALPADGWYAVPVSIEYRSIS
jgi:hypothetical protein